MKPLISVIVPIYGIERYIGICIESILNQTYKNLEIILVDDGSNDRCPELCDLYAKKDNRIKVIHKKNGGLVSARKAGMQESSGSYICYVDGDDWVEPCFVENLFVSISSFEADMVCSGFMRDLFDQSVPVFNSLHAGLYENEDLNYLFNNMLSYGAFFRPGITTYVWNKMFKREIVLDSQMSVDNRITIGEDAAVTYPVLLKCKKVVVSKDTSYHYRQREDSMLKQSASFLSEAIKLKYLYNYMDNWAKDKGYGLTSQVADYVLSNAIMRSGGRIPQSDFSVFGSSYYDRRIVICSAGTFGQQFVNRIKEINNCTIVAWLDDDYWEYRRCCLDVDDLSEITDLDYDFVLIAKVDSEQGEILAEQLKIFGVPSSKILVPTVPGCLSDREMLLNQFLDIESLEKELKARRKEVVSHA